MKLLGIFLTACVVLAAAQAAAITIVLAIGLALVVALFLYPLETINSLIALVALGVFARVPAESLAVITLTLITKWAKNRHRSRRGFGKRDARLPEQLRLRPYSDLSD